MKELFANDDFKVFFYPFMIADKAQLCKSKGELLFWTTTVSLKRVLNFS